MSKDDPHYYTRILQALAAGHYLQAAKRVPRSDWYQLVRSGMDVALSEHTNLGESKKHNEWVIYGECFNNGKNKVLRMVSAIAPELLVAAQPEYWWDTEFLPEGHIKAGLLQTLADMIGFGGIIPLGRQWPGVGSANWIGLAQWVVECIVADRELLQRTLPSWRRERNARFAKVGQLKRWNLQEAIAAGFDDGSSRYGHPDKYQPSLFSILEQDKKKLRNRARKLDGSITSSGW